MCFDRFGVTKLQPPPPLPFICALEPQSSSPPPPPPRPPTSPHFPLYSALSSRTAPAPPLPPFLFPLISVSRCRTAQPPLSAPSLCFCLCRLTCTPPRLHLSRPPELQPRSPLSSIPRTPMANIWWRRWAVAAVAVAVIWRWRPYGGGGHGNFVAVIAAVVVAAAVAVAAWRWCSHGESSVVQCWRLPAGGWVYWGCHGVDVGSRTLSFHVYTLRRLSLTLTYLCSHGKVPLPLQSFST